MEASTESELPTFDAWPEDPELMPAPSLVALSLQTHGVQAACAEYAAQVSYKTDVSVSTIAAARTGAEIGALLVEAPVTESAKLAERVQRIQAGLASLNDEGLGLQETSKLLVFLSQDPAPAQVSIQLDQLHAGLLMNMESQSNNELLPVLLAGAWMQAYLLIAQGLQAIDNPGPGHALFHHPPRRGVLQRLRCQHRTGHHPLRHVGTLRADPAQPADDHAKGPDERQGPGDRSPRPRRYFRHALSRPKKTYSSRVMRSKVLTTSTSSAVMSSP